MKRLPQKNSLVTQTAAILLEEIQARRWTSWLPGELDLCRQLRVSRTTLRSALDQLARQGILQSHQGRRRQITAGASSRRKTKSNRVILLMPDPSHGRLIRAFLIDRLREHLAEEGYLLETHISRAPFRSGPQRELEKLKTMLNPAGWVIMGSTEPLQKWFSSGREPCVIAGTRYARVDLPSVDVDYAAICHHAVGRFVSAGYERIILLNPHPGAAGELVTEDCFRKAGTKARRGELCVVRHNGTAENICAKVDSLMTHSRVPTGFMVSRARHALTVLCRLLHTGVHVPQEAAVISRDDETYLEDVVPTMARYSINPDMFAKKLSAAVLGMVCGNYRIIDHRIMARFVRGQTIK